MAFFTAFTQLVQRSKLNQLPRMLQPSRHNHPGDDAVLVDTKNYQDSLCRDDSTVTLGTSHSVTPLPVDSTNSKKPHAIYNGGYENAKVQGVRLRIANGGAGQTGLIRAWADKFIQDMVSKGISPFEVCHMHISQDLID